ncbi:LysR family transcriptional regulator [Actinoplanes sp. NPDC049316]|uniref:LysR family transcriptional regulator n=1 Tax=Actinoplanes sp. NPDC049316 TaxID=3154727 RepID=UPI00343FD531
MSDQKSDEAAGDSRLDLMLLRTFLAVYRAGSVTAGARLLGLSQPTVTGQVRALEHQLGRRLFDRVPRGVVATSVADELAGRVAGPLDELAAVTAHSPASRPEALAEPVHVAGPAEILSARVLPALAPLVARGVRLRVATGLADDLLDGLRVGRFDLVLSAVRPRGRTLVAVPLMDEEFVLVAAPVWAERVGPVDPQDPRSLEDAPLVTYAEDLPIARRYWRHVFHRRLNASAAVVIPDLRGVLAAVTAGAGITVLPRYLCESELASGRLALLLDPADPPINTGFLAQRAGARRHPHLTLVRETLIREARTW